MHSAKILESDEIGLDLTVNENRSREMNIEFTDEPGFVNPRDLARRKYQSDLQRSELNPSHHENLIELNTPTEGGETDDTQMEKPNSMEFSKSISKCWNP